MTPSLLEIDSVIKSFDGRQVLTDIYLRCATGDIIGILGRNGSGKSTLLKILFGVQQAERHFIRIDDRVLDKPFKVRDQIVYLPQHNFLLSNVTLEKIYRLYFGNNNLEEFFDDPILLPLKGVKVADLSGGEARYMEVKLLLNTKARFVLLDEPFNGIAPVVIDHLRNLIGDAATNKGIILTDHDYRNVLAVANKYCLLYDGGLKRIKDKEELVRWNYLTGNQFDDNKL